MLPRKGAVRMGDVDLDAMQAMAQGFPDHPLGPALLQVVEHARRMRASLYEREDIRQRAMDWLSGRDTGLSSQAMCLTLLGGKVRWPHHPHDPADLGRCLRLLQVVPEWRGRLNEVAALSPEWAALVGAWSEIEALYREEEPSGTAPRCYERMRDLLESANRS